MQSKFVFVTELHADKTKLGKDYRYFLDQDKERWNLFNGEKVELNKGYIFRFEMSGEYRNVKEFEPVINIFKQEALKQVADINSIKKDYSISLTQAIQVYAIEGKIPPTETLFGLTDQIYQFIQQRSESLMSKDNPKG